LFTRRPAPIQITWAGYVGTTGLASMDYIIADRFHIPDGEERHYTETVLRLPNGYVCFDYPFNAPAISSLPAKRNGYVTFGCFNNTAKINSKTLRKLVQNFDVNIKF